MIVEAVFNGILLKRQENSVKMFLDDFISNAQIIASKM